MPSSSSTPSIAVESHADLQMVRLQQPVHDNQVGMQQPLSCDSMSVIWLSLDPRRKKLNVYPKDVAMCIEQCFQAKRLSVCLSRFGGYYMGATVELENTKSGHPEQHTRQGGRRDVRRIEILPSAREVVVHVFREHGWKITDDSSFTNVEECRVQLFGHEQILAAEVPGTRGTKNDVERREARLATVRKTDDDGHMAVWEWCRAVNVKFDELGRLPAEMW